MIQPIRAILSALAVVLTIGACAAPAPQVEPSPWDIKHIVAPVQQAVVTVITYDLDDRASTIGSGFFISKTGVLVTNHHVINGAYRAEIKTLSGELYPVTEVLAQNPLVDLIKGTREDSCRSCYAPAPCRRGTGPRRTGGGDRKPPRVGANRLRRHHLGHSRNPRLRQCVFS